MQLWRIYRRAHGPGLDGVGGLYSAGRWHEAGTRVVYFGASAGITVLEKLVHVGPRDLPNDLVLGCFEGDLSVENIRHFEIVAELSMTRARGAAFFEGEVACLLQVPSFVLPEESNLILNPVHEDAAGIRMASERDFFFDRRLL